MSLGHDLQSLVFALSSQRMYRDLFWHLATIGPFVLLVLAACLALPRSRRRVAAALLISAAGAVAFTVVFHYTYVLAIWGAHSSAIRYLDESALWAGFAAAAIACGCGSAVYAGLRWASGACRPRGRAQGT